MKRALILVSVALMSMLAITMHFAFGATASSDQKLHDQLDAVEASLDADSYKIALYCIEHSEALNQWSEVIAKSLHVAPFKAEYGITNRDFETLEVIDAETTKTTDNLLYWCVAWDESGTIISSSLNSECQLVWPIDPETEGGEEFIRGINGMIAGEVREFVSCDTGFYGTLKYLVLATPDIGGIYALKADFTSIYAESIRLKQQILVSLYGEVYSHTADNIASLNWPYCHDETFQRLSERAKRYYQWATESDTVAERILEEKVQEYSLAKQQQTYCSGCGFGESSWTDKVLGEFVLASVRLEQESGYLPVSTLE